jgi:hypothetical protein
MEMKYDIFVSYCRSDRELVAAVVQRLEARGVGVWYDADIEGGADWRETIVEALTHSDMLAIFFSEDCNNSRQLKKELAVADSLGKPVVPILIENTQPRGAYLYELADRNWIQAWPEPMDRIDELVEHLATLAGKSAGGLAGLAHAKPAAPAKFEIVSPAAANDGIPAPAANDDVAEAEQPLDEAVGEFIHGTDRPAKAAPRIAAAYVGSASHPGKPRKKLNDILPFRWIDLVFLGPLVAAAIGFFVVTGGLISVRLELYDVLSLAFVGIMVIGLYGAVVFPVRYYLRRLSMLEALGKYLASSLILYAVFVGSFLFAHWQGVFPDEPVEFTLIAAAVWGVFTLVAFVIYGVLAGQRAMRSFRSNIRKL